MTPLIYIYSPKAFPPPLSIEALNSRPSFALDWTLPISEDEVVSTTPPSPPSSSFFSSLSSLWTSKSSSSSSSSKAARAMLPHIMASCSWSFCLTSS